MTAQSEYQLAPKEPTQEMSHPMQQIVVAEDGVIRFRSNAIVRYLLDNGGIDLNALARLNFSVADQNQFAQLIGYSVSGFGDLSYADPALVEQADAIAAKLYEPRPSAHVELLPCPFCGAEPLLRESPGPLWVVQCFECGAEASSRTDVRDVAIECWNRRAPSSPPSAETSAEVERLLRSALAKSSLALSNLLHARHCSRCGDSGFYDAGGLLMEQSGYEPDTQPCECDMYFAKKEAMEAQAEARAAIDAARAKGKESGNG